MMTYVLVYDVMKLNAFSFVPQYLQDLLVFTLHLHFIQLCREDYELLADSESVDRNL